MYAHGILIIFICLCQFSDPGASVTNAKSLLAKSF